MKGNMHQAFVVGIIIQPRVLGVVTSMTLVEIVEPVVEEGLDVLEVPI